MRFTIVYRGRIAASGRVDQIKAIRQDRYLQTQLEALYAVTSKAFASGNKQIVVDTLYTAILPISWVCAVEIVLLRATPLAKISGSPDIDNTLKTLFDALCAPAGASFPEGTHFANKEYVLAIEDKQFSTIAVSSDQHWMQSPDDDMAMIRVTTQV